MKLSVLTTTLYEENWNITADYQAHIAYMKEKALCVMPTPSSDILPDGTANAALKYLYQRTQLHCWLTSVIGVESVPVIFEKSATALWARVELPGLLLVTRGCTSTCITEQLRVLLTSLIASRQHQVEPLNFQPAYDTSTVWELMQAFKTNRIAEQTGIDSQLLGRIMAGTAHPCPEQTKQLETSLRQLGKQLMQVSLR